MDSYCPKAWCFHSSYLPFGLGYSYFCYKLPSPHRLRLLLLFIVIRKGIVMCVGIDPPVIGFLLLFYGTSLLSMGYAFGRWYYDDWKWSTAVANAGIFATAMYLAFQIGTVFVPPYSFFGISICLLSINMLPTIQIILIQTPEYRLNFSKFLSVSS
jgi:hypothetical protein